MDSLLEQLEFFQDYYKMAQQKYGADAAQHVAKQIDVLLQSGSFSPIMHDLFAALLNAVSAMDNNDDNIKELKQSIMNMVDMLNDYCLMENANKCMDNISDVNNEYNHEEDIDIWLDLPQPPYTPPWQKQPPVKATLYKSHC